MSGEEIFSWIMCVMLGILPLAVLIIGGLAFLIKYLYNSWYNSIDHSRYYLIRVVNKNNIKDYIIHSEDDNRLLKKFIKNKKFPISVDAEYLEEDEVLEFFPEVASVSYRFNYSINTWLKNNNKTIIYFYMLPNTVQAARLIYTKEYLPTKNKIKKVIEEN